jgi:hypothetical protein
MSDLRLLMFSSHHASKGTPLHSKFERLCFGLAIDLLIEVIAAVFIFLTTTALCCIPMCYQA